MIFRLPLFVDNGAMGIVFSGEEEGRLHLFHAARRVSNNQDTPPESGTSRKMNGEEKV